MTPNAFGIALAVIAAACFATTAALVKVAIAEFHVLQILFVRQACVFATTLPSLSRAFPASLHTRFPGWHAVRLLGAFAALSCSIWALSLLPLSTAITLGFAQVFFVALLARASLGEAVGPHRIAAVAIGFVGVLVVMRPGVAGLSSAGALVALAGALGAAVAVVCVRRLSQTDSSATLLAWQSICIGAIAAAPMPWVWQTPDAHGAALLLAIGVLSSVGQWIGVSALRHGEASVVGNVEYTKLLYAAVLGYALFDEVPDAWTGVGAAIIVAAGGYLFHREARARQRNQRA
ncbi:MAG: DMT family transporter [Pseudomonadota bacterium]